MPRAVLAVYGCWKIITPDTCYHFARAVLWPFLSGLRRIRVFRRGAKAGAVFALDVPNARLYAQRICVRGFLCGNPRARNPRLYIIGNTSIDRARIWFANNGDLCVCVRVAACIDFLSQIFTKKPMRWICSRDNGVYATKTQNVAWIPFTIALHCTERDIFGISGICNIRGDVILVFYIRQFIVIISNKGSTMIVNSQSFVFM